MKPQKVRSKVFKTPLDRVMLTFATALALIMLVTTGADIQADNALTAIFSFVSGLFFLAIVWTVVLGRFAALKYEANKAAFEKVKPVMDNLIEAAKEMLEIAKMDVKRIHEETEADKTVEADKHELDDHEQAMSKLVMKLAYEVLEGEPRIPTDDEIKRIEQRFTEVTGDHAVKITNEGHGLACEFMRIGGGIPVTRSVDGLEAKPVATHTAPDAPKRSKSQQRRINSQKGLGALTDDEVKAAKNEKRRAARAAKAAADMTLKQKIAAEK